MFKMRPIRLGFVGFGEVNTPRDIIEKKCSEAVEQLKNMGMDLLVASPVSDDSNGKEAARAVDELREGEFDALVVCVAGWIPSWAVFSVIEPFKHIPMILWGLSGWQDGDRFVTTADQAGTTALRKPMKDMGYKFKYVVNYLGQAASLEEIKSFAKAARAASLLKKAKIGMMGYRDMRLYGTLYDGVSLKGKIGPEIEHFEMLEIAQMMESLGDDEIKALTHKMLNEWSFAKEPKSESLENAARLASALKAKLTERGYDAFSFVDVDGVKKLMKFAPAGALTLLHEIMDICTVPENDSMGAVTQLAARYLTGQCSAYLEFYEFMPNGALMGVPDYVPSEIVDGKVAVMPTSFGDFGEGLLNVSRLKTGRVTIARMSYSGDKYSIHVMSGKAVAPRKWEEAGWTPPAPQLPSLEIIFDKPVEEFIQRVAGQHYIISYGDHIVEYKDLCAILDMQML